MQRCEYCGSHIFYKSLAQRWEDIIGGNDCVRAFHKIHQPQQDAAFYVTQKAWERVWYSDTHEVLRVNELRVLLRDDSVIRTTEALVASGIHHDIALEIAVANGDLRVVSRPHFEVCSIDGSGRKSEHAELDAAIKECERVSRKGSISSVGEIIDELLAVFEANKKTR